MLKSYCQSLHDFSSLSLVTLPPYHCPTWCYPQTRLMSYLVILKGVPTSPMTSTDRLMIDLVTSKEAIKFSCAPPSALTATSPWSCPSFYTTLNWRSKSPLHSYDSKEGKPVKFYKVLLKTQKFDNFASTWPCVLVAHCHFHFIFILSEIYYFLAAAQSISSARAVQTLNFWRIKFFSPVCFNLKWSLRVAWFPNSSSHFLQGAFGLFAGSAS